MLTARKLTLGRSLQQLRQVWINAGQTERNRITGDIRPGRPPEDYHLVQRQIDACLLGSDGAVSAHARAADRISMHFANTSLYLPQPWARYLISGWV